MQMAYASDIHMDIDTYMEDQKRKTGKDKRKETFKKYGKNTTRGLRHKLEQCQQNTSKARSGSKTK
jgi:hypothetical protein